MCVHIYMFNRHAFEGEGLNPDACGNSAGAFTTAEILQTLQNEACYRGTHPRGQRWLSRLAAQADAVGSSIPSQGCPGACSPATHWDKALPQSDSSNAQN